MTNNILLKHFTLVGNEILFLDTTYLKLDNSINLSNPFHKKLLFDEEIIKKNSRKKVLIIEPHLDDCALSCTGYLIKSLKSGNKITLLNIFSKGKLNSFPWKNINISEQKYENLRLYEAKTFCDYLEINFISFKLKQATKRNHDSPFSALNKIDQKLIYELSKKFSKLIENYDIILYPGGVQEHIDHIVVYEAISLIEKSHPEKKFIVYEEYPYASNKIAFQGRIKKISENKKIKPKYIPVRNNLEIMANLAIIYRSQFDDINNIQMLALFQDRCRAITQEGISQGLKLKGEFHQRIYEVQNEN